MPQLKIAFAAPLAAARARAEGPFAVVERPADGQEHPTQKWVDLSGKGLGFTLFNDSRYGYDALGGRLRMTLLRNAYGPDPDTDNGTHRIRLGFVPQGGAVPSAALVRQGMAFNRPPWCLPARGAPRKAPPWLRIDGAAGIVCTSLHRAERAGGLILRFFEADGRPGRAEVRCGGGIIAAAAVAFLERPVRDAVRVRRGAARLRFRPYEVKTLRIRTAR